MDKNIIRNKLLNRIYLDNIREVSDKIHEWKLAQDKKFLSILLKNSHFAIGDVRATLNESLQKIITDVESSLMRHLIALAYEYGDESVDMLTTSEKNEFSNLKQAIGEEDSIKTFDQNNIMKILRQTMAHNSDSISEPNWTTDLHSNTIISKPLKKNRVAKMTLSADDAHNLILLYFKKTYQSVPAVAQFDEDLLIKKLKQNSLNILDIKEIFDKDNTLDSYQTKTLFNLCQSLKKDFLKGDIDLTSSLLFHVGLIAFPHKNNAHNNFFINSYNLGFINSLRVNPTAIEYKKDNNFHKIQDTPKLGEFLSMQTYKNIEHGLIINALFYLFSISTPQELEKYFQSSKLYQINPTELRNSIIHGRYYYNYNNGYEFYDGPNTDNLRHIGSIKVKDLSALLKHTFHIQINELANEVPTI